MPTDWRGINGERKSKPKMNSADNKYSSMWSFKTNQIWMFIHYTHSAIAMGSNVRAAIFVVSVARNWKCRWQCASTQKSCSIHGATIWMMRAVFFSLAKACLPGCQLQHNLMNSLQSGRWAKKKKNAANNIRKMRAKWFIDMDRVERVFFSPLSMFN